MPRATIDPRKDVPPGQRALARTITGSDGVSQGSGDAAADLHVRGVQSPRDGLGHPACELQPQGPLLTQACLEASGVRVADRLRRQRGGGAEGQVPAHDRGGDPLSGPVAKIATFAPTDRGPATPRSTVRPRSP